MSFWLAATLLCLLAVAFLLPALRRHARNAPGVDASRLAVYRHRFRELDNDHAAGVLDAAQYEEARAELEANAALELEASPAPATRPARHAWWTGAIVLVLVPLAAVGLYTQVGSWDEAARSGQPGAATGHPEDLETLVGQLAERMQAQPDDLQGWMLLGRSSLAIGEPEQAVHAWRQAMRLAGPDNAVVLANLAEALGMTEPDGLRGEAAPLLERALELDPDNPKALFYGGMLALEQERPRLASERLYRLLAQDPPDNLRAVIERRLQQISGIVVEVGIDTALASRLPDSATLFVTAHAAGEAAGPPLAALRREGVGLLPVQVVLSDANRMQAGASLLEHEALVLTARLTQGDTAERRPGDLVGRITWQRSAATQDTQPVVVLDRVLKQP